MSSLAALSGALVAPYANFATFCNTFTVLTLLLKPLRHSPSHFSSPQPLLVSHLCSLAEVAPQSSTCTHIITFP